MLSVRGKGQMRREEACPQKFLADVRSRMVNMNMSLAGSLRGAQKESTVSRLLRGAKDDGEGG
jgi:hypothetical protein